MGWDRKGLNDRQKDCWAKRRIYNRSNLQRSSPRRAGRAHPLYAASAALISAPSSGPDADRTCDRGQGKSAADVGEGEPCGHNRYQRQDALTAKMQYGVPRQQYKQHYCTNIWSLRSARQHRIAYPSPPPIADTHTSSTSSASITAASLRYPSLPYVSSRNLGSRTV